ncbi:hypothetical protein [Rhizobium alvei]|uniref:Uncharacterized protein n=1 Tax=Rhizobium alvei TaxID=1132659 RepID=A0ABT8YTJ2_9HYPH|nr:hypothetical protein [Rhizobium alvei]MDO6966682.1 hypothetical protein [Rhizobium alvei]
MGIRHSGTRQRRSTQAHILAGFAVTLIRIGFTDAYLGPRNAVKAD